MPASNSDKKSLPGPDESLKLIAFPGDGIGPEIMAATLRIVDLVNQTMRLGLSIEIEEIGFASLEKRAHTIPDEAVDKARRADGIILGPCDTFGYPPSNPGSVNPSSKLRLTLDLYANIRPSRTIAGTDSLAKAMDLVIVRENTEGFYADRNMFMGSGEFMPTPDVALAIRKITAASSRRIAVVACKLALTRRKKLTIVSKANVLKLSDGLFLREAQEASAQYPELEVNHVLVDAMASNLVRTPGLYDVIVTTNMFGDILSNQASELAGGLGLAGSLNASDSHAMAQASHGCAPDIAGQDKANPCSLIFSTTMLLDWLAERHARPRLAQAARLIAAAVCDLLAAPDTRTTDLNGVLGTTEFAAAVCRRLEQRM